MAFFFIIFFFEDIFLDDIFFFIMGFFMVAAPSAAAAGSAAAAPASGAAGAVWASATPKLSTEAAQARARVFFSRIHGDSLSSVCRARAHRGDTQLDQSATHRDRLSFG